MRRRSPGHKRWAKAAVGTFADAASFGEVVVLATLGVANESAIKMAGLENFRGKVLVDTTNPLDFSGGVPPKLAVSRDDSAGERVQRLLSEARVVKAFNTVGTAFMLCERREFRLMNAEDAGLPTQCGRLRPLGETSRKWLVARR
jgi:hypothetical protein